MKAKETKGYKRSKKPWETTANQRTPNKINGNQWTSKETRGNERKYMENQ